METQIFEDFKEFNKREDKSINGVSPEFAERFPNYKVDNETNSGCWECNHCDHCVNCDFCNDCKRCNYCRHCKNCKNCRLCESCNYCENCVDCDYCKNCIDCESCDHCELCTSYKFIWKRCNALGRNNRPDS